MAYQARVAIDRIRFVIKHTEQLAPYTDQMRDASFQLLDALRRLETVDRRSQGAALGHDRRREIVDAAMTHASVLRGVRPQVMSEEVSEDKAHEPGCPA